MLFERSYRELISGRWQGPVPAALRGGLGVLELPYAWLVGHRNARFDRGNSHPQSVAAPVISVGNLTVGGTGKTPLVAWLARWLVERQVAVTIISRGYGSRPGQPNDEALELAAQLPGVPHVQDANRLRAAGQALVTNPRQALVLDDAFQHRRLARDLDIVLLDALAPFGYDHLLPRGLLREPVASLKRADVVALSRSDGIGSDQRREIESRVRGMVPQALWLELVHRPAALLTAAGQRLAVADFRGKRVAAFCGIGNPAGFRHTLEACDLSIAQWLEFPDHCAYRDADIACLERWLAPRTDVDAVLCTRKDLVKIPRDRIGGKQLFAVEIELVVVQGLAAFEAILGRTIAAVSG